MSEELPFLHRQQRAASVLRGHLGGCSRKGETNGTHTVVPKLVVDLGAHIDNAFSTSEQCTGAANKARRLNFMIKHYFEDLSKSDFIP